MKKIAIINGPNLNRLGTREPGIYGKGTLADLEADLRARTREKEEIHLEFFQSNHEGELIDRIAACDDNGFTGVILNPGGLTHTSVALRDCVAGTSMTCVEVHISNIYRREEFRQKSVTAAACAGVISGLGFHGYHAALQFILELKS